MSKSVRRKYDDDFDDDSRSAKRRRLSTDAAEIEDRLESLIIRVGERSTASLESNLEGLSSVLENDLVKAKNKIQRILVDCASKMPERSSVYSTLVGLLNAKNYNFGGEFAESLVRCLKDSLKICEWDKARNCLRFLSDLVNCHVVSASSLLAVYDNFLDAAMETGVPQVRTDWLVYAVLTCLPWVGRELFEKREADLDRLLATIRTYLDRRSKKHVPALRVWSSDDPHPQEEQLDCLWAQISKLRADSWQEKHILRPYLAFDSILSEALQHKLPDIQAPLHHATNVYPQPKVVFRMFDYTDCPESGPILPGAHSIERYLIEEHIHHILEVHHNDRKECSAQLLNFPHKTKIPLDYMIVEVVFAELFQMPSPRFLEINYGCILIELCKLQPSTIPQVLAQATEILFERIDTMNVSAFQRFVTWFSYHLSNFHFRWSWADWADCLTLDPEHPKPKFVRETFEKSLRLSYHQRVQEMAGQEFAALVPLEPKPRFRYGEEGAASLAGTMVAHQLITAIKERCTPEEAIRLLKEMPNPLKAGDDDAEPTHNPLKIEVFTETLIYVGSKSFSHAFAAIAKFRYVFKVLAETEEAQICVLRSLYEVWKNHPQMMCVLVDKMLKTQIVECSAVANWIFSREMNAVFLKSYVWEILNLTIRKMSQHVHKLTVEAAEARARLHRDSEDSDSDEERRDRPSDEQVERMEERLEQAQSDQKTLFLIIFQRFIMILSEHLVRSDTDGRDFRTHWWKWTFGRLQQIFMQHNEQVHKYSQTLETLLFTQDLDPHVLDAFHQFLALRA
ncbi:nuclear cap-binding protein subunit 1-like [Pollicipes pollicipes]|uniref:nuclear cap-binding protein subunit 1-like n=1 Tax=Pollicipes pollicipes TaxID=41117 RepID=UPI001884C7CD|nr:nuclear cap-binding protein subunit 1-like [Pollicipes pollicipes]XP_037080723.1 nuclear cap-binding protein subunit 1-like [Pollicipes pollicipes]